MGNVSTPSLKEYIPPKNWEELTDSEKIERMRETIKQQNHSLNLARTQIYNLRLRLKNHTHRDGKVMEIKEIEDYYDDGREHGLVGIPPMSNDKYF